MCLLDSRNGRHKALALNGFGGARTGEPQDREMSWRLPPFDVGADVCCGVTQGLICSTAEDRWQWISHHLSRAHQLHPCLADAGGCPMGKQRYQQHTPVKASTTCPTPDIKAKPLMIWLIRYLLPRLGVE